MRSSDIARRARLALVADFLQATAALPVEEVAEAAGVGVPTATRWRRSGVRTVHDATLRRVASYLGVTEVPVMRPSRAAARAAVDGA
ncbi:MAG TPA: helix-turn-helix transcriptional regulator [Longimicrobiaceae bacterium]|nr:helix-turn-helix transcriptional regulator [Longimicrobiaceae bacterium]